MARKKPTDDEMLQALDELKQEYEAMTKKLTKLTKVNESFTVYRYDNGFMVEVSGRDKKSDYKTIKVLCNTEAELFDTIKEALAMELDD